MMTIVNFTIRRAAFIATFLFFACIDVPVEIVVDENVELSNTTTQKLADKVLEKLKKVVKFENGACTEIFIEWAEIEFANNLVPQRTVYASEFGKYSADPEAKNCEPVDLKTKFESAFNFAQIDELKSRTAYIADFAEFRDVMQKSDCRRRLIDPDEARISLKNIRLRFSENSLNYPAPPFNLYYSTTSVDKEKLKHDAQKYIEDKTLIQFGHIPLAQSAFLGEKIAILDDDRKTEAYAALRDLNKQIVAFPAAISPKDLEVTIEGQKFYVIPNGHAKASLLVRVSLMATMSDALCFLEEYKARIRALSEKK
jgi:hypothetical protein